MESECKMIEQNSSVLQFLHAPAAWFQPIQSKVPKILALTTEFARFRMSASSVTVAVCKGVRMCCAQGLSGPMCNPQRSGQGFANQTCMQQLHRASEEALATEACGWHSLGVAAQCVSGRSQAVLAHPSLHICKVQMKPPRPALSPQALVASSPTLFTL
jgi:hypothetical protein